MEKLAIYRNHIKELIRRHSHPSAYGDVEIQQIFDTENDHYQLVHAGWHRKQRQYGCIIHADIRNGKIWIQHDGTEAGFADELVELGVPKEDIVLAYHIPLIKDRIRVLQQRRRIFGTCFFVSSYENRLIFFLTCPINQDKQSI